MRETIQNANGKQFHAVSLSGGKDSTAMLLLMIERGMPIDMVLSADTGMEFPEMYEHLAKLDEHCLPLSCSRSYPRFPLYPYYNLNRAFWPDFRKKFCLGGVLTFQNVPFRKKMQAIYISSVDF